MDEEDECPTLTDVLDRCVLLDDRLDEEVPTQQHQQSNANRNVNDERPQPVGLPAPQRPAGGHEEDPERHQEGGRLAEEDDHDGRQEECVVNEDALCDLLQSTD